MNYLIPEAFVRELRMYFGTRPYDEVATAVRALESLQPAEPTRDDLKAARQANDHAQS